ncbi:MAG: hypothetical protein FJ028_10665, partial [Chloroflexi bacterium]|nr:hypothetical protein [Chloroflexota bacterium]
LALGASWAAAACVGPATNASPFPTAQATRGAPSPKPLAQLSVEEKAGQLMTVAFKGTRVTSHLESMIRKGHVGGVILFAENAGEAGDVARLAGELQTIALEAGAHRLLIAIDHEGGAVVRVGKGFTVLPSAMAPAATPDPVASVERAPGSPRASCATTASRGTSRRWPTSTTSRATPCC